MFTRRLIRPRAVSLLSLVTVCALVLVAAAPAASSVAPPTGTGVQVQTEAAQPSALGLAPLALVAEEGIAIERGVTVDGGGIAVRSASDGPYLTSTDAELVLARDVRVTDQEAVVAADTVRIDRDVQVPNLAYNDGSVVGTVTGTTTSPVTVPLDVQVPTTPCWSQGPKTSQSCGAPNCRSRRVTTGGSRWPGTRPSGSPTATTSLSR